MSRMFLVAVIALTSCGRSGEAMLPAAGDSRDAWRTEFQRTVAVPPRLRITDARIDEMNDYYCDDAASDWEEYFRAMVYEHLPSGLLDTTPASVLGAAAMGASAATTDCPGIVDRDKIAAALVDARD